MKEIYMKLLQQLKNSNAQPFLFIGAGLSRRYLNSPNWQDLLTYFAKKIKHHNFAFQEYENAAKKRLYELSDTAPSHCMLMATIADLIEFDFNTYWYSADEYQGSRNQCQNAKQNFSPFKFEVSNYIRSFTLPDDPELQNELALLDKVINSSLSGIITTNYDMLIDNLITDYDIYIGQDDMIFSYMLGGSEYYKIHGSIALPESIVINSLDYKDFNTKNAYLASKLLTIFMEHPIIFIGYSLSDENIESILSSISDCVSQEQLSRLSNRLIFIDFSTSFETLEILNKTFQSNHSTKTLPMTKIATNDFVGLYECLLQHIPKTNIKLVNKLKKEIVGLVSTNTPSKFLAVYEDDLDYSKLENAELFVGIGQFVRKSKHGIINVKVTAIYEDVVKDKDFEGIYQDFSYDEFVNDTLKEIISSHGGSRANIPIYKYIRKCTEPLDPYIHSYALEHHSSFDEYTPTTQKKSCQTLSDLLLELSPKEAVVQVKSLDEKNVDPSLLQKTLNDIFEENPRILEDDDNKAIRTDMRRAIGILDWLLYGKDYVEKNKNAIPK